MLAEALGERGYPCLVPRLVDSDNSPLPYWQQHVDSVMTALASVPTDQGLYLAGHSGAGPLLPVISQALANPIVATLFVDAGIPIDGASRLDLLKLELPEAAGPFQRLLEKGQRLPQWTADDLQDEIPDPIRRQLMLQELHPRPLAFFTEPLPVPAEWTSHHCFYLQFSAAYDYSAATARARGWDVRRMNGGHFHMLVNPVAVANILLEWVGKAIY
jgi:hypothetical protein